VYKYGFLLDFVKEDNDLKLTFHEVVFYAVLRMEKAIEAKNKRVYFKNIASG
tara:strand:- start:11 stop:166 length:156 start_codon:yes stop_codon:yes gene_type:complete